MDKSYSKARSRDDAQNLLLVLRFKLPQTDMETHMSYIPHFLHNLMDMGSLLGTILGTILNYKKDPNVHC